MADPAVTQANIGSTICVPGYSSSHRHVSQSEKDRVYAEYGITHHAPGEYDVDHLISLELGGSNDIANLWPEPYGGPDNAHTKDGMENRLHAEVCAGQLTLARAQDEIVHWWMYEKAAPPGSPRRSFSRTGTSPPGRCAPPPSDPDDDTAADGRTGQVCEAPGGPEL